MRYFFLDGTYIPKHCIYGPRQKEAVLFDDWEWYTINDNLHRWDRDRQIAELYAAKEQNKKDFSYNLTKNWQNTLASIKTQSEQRRIEKREKDRQDKIDKYNEILESRKEAKKQIFAKARMTLFEEKDSTKTLVNALVKCAVLTEREKQIEFKNRLKEVKAKQEAEYAEKIKKDVEEYKKEMEEEKKKKAEEKRKLCQSLKKELEERRKMMEEREMRKKNAEREDLAKMIKTFESLKECERKDIQDKIKRSKMYKEKSYFRCEYEKSLAMEEEEENEINKMINKYGKRFAKERTAKEKNMIAEAIENRRKLTEKLAKDMEKKEVKQNEILEKAIRESEEESLKKEKAKEEERRKAEIEMKKWQIEQKAKAASEENKKRVQLKWAMLQNERKRDIDNELANERKKQEIEKKKKIAEGYAMQLKEKKEMEEEQRKKDNELVADKDDVEKLLKYCDDTIEYVKSRGWNDYAINVAVTKLKKELGLQSATKELEKDEISKHGRHKCERPTGIFCYCFKN